MRRPLLIIGGILTMVVFSVGWTTLQQPLPIPTASAAPSVSPTKGEPYGFGSEVVSSLMGALVGGIIGIAAGWISANHAHTLTTARDKETEAAMNEAVRKMLRVEIEQNLASVRGDAERTNVNSMPDDRAIYEWLALQPCPEWSTAVWEGTMLIAVKALEPSEAAKVQTFYSSLHSLTVARAALVDQWERTPTPWQMTVPTLRCQELTSSILDVGNPLNQCDG